MTVRIQSLQQARKPWEISVTFGVSWRTKCHRARAYSLCRQLETKNCRNQFPPPEAMGSSHRAKLCSILGFLWAVLIKPDWHSSVMGDLSSFGRHLDKWYYFDITISLKIKWALSHSKWRIGVEKSDSAHSCWWWNISDDWMGISI